MTEGGSMIVQLMALWLIAVLLSTLVALLDELRR